MTYDLHLGDNRIVLRTLPDNSVDAIVCDPPYELGFMGKAWDSSGIAYDCAVWAQCLRVLKPGGHLIAFGGSRTYHRMAVAIEDAGFEIRDQIQWIYASGFPKSLDVSKAMDRQAGAEREVITEKWRNQSNKPEFATQWGFGANTEGKYNITAPATDLAKRWHGWGTALKPAHEPAVLARKPLTGTVADNVTAWGTGALNIEGTRITTAGRWPSNVILDEEAAEVLDAQSGERHSSGIYFPKGNGDNIKGVVTNFVARNIPATMYSDSGGASRFFYVAKASKAEREAGLDAPIGQRANIHSTVKPIDLMRYMVRLVTPPGGVVLDPFMGSGSTGCAAVLEGMRFIGIDITPEYVEIARRRIAHHAAQGTLPI